MGQGRSFPGVGQCLLPAGPAEVPMKLLEKGDVVLATRADAAQYQAVARIADDARYVEDAR